MVADKGVGLERRCLRGKSKVKIPVSMQDDAAAKHSLSARFFGISFAEITTRKLDFNPNWQTVFAGRIGRCRIGRQLQLGVVFTVAEEEFVLLYEAYRPSNLPFPHSAYERFSLANKDPTEC